MNQDLQLRGIEVKSGHPVSRKKGFFHRWCTEPFLYDPDVWMKRTYALVELEDGSVRFIEPEFIKFSEPYDKNPFK
jgi:hypothetical protein